MPYKKTSIVELALGVFLLIIFSFTGYIVHANPQIIRTDFKIEKSKKVGLSDQVILDFSFPVDRDSVEKNIAVHPREKMEFSWKDSNKRLILKPLNNWKDGQIYSISMSGARNIFFTRISSSADFETVKYPAVTAVYPESGSKDVAVDIENQITVSFDDAIDDFNIKFSVDPFDQFDYEIASDKKTVRLMLKNEFNYGTKYAIVFFIKHKNENTFRKIGETTFETAPVPEIDSKALKEIRLEQAKKYTKPEIATGKSIDINLKQQIMVIFENGISLDAYLISSGRKGMETPTGSYAIRNKASHPWSKEYSLFMPNWMALVPDGKFGIHELPEWPGGYKEGANHLGTPVSHGCVRLGVGSAKRVYDWAEVGTPVHIHY